MIEKLRIITGSAKSVQAKAQIYLTEHPNATVLGTSIGFKRGEAIEEEEPAPPPAATGTDEAAPPAATVLRCIQYGPDVEVVSITLGRVF